MCRGFDSRPCYQPFSPPTLTPSNGRLYNRNGGGRLAQLGERLLHTHTSGNAVRVEARRPTKPAQLSALIARLRLVPVVLPLQPRVEPIPPAVHGRRYCSKNCFPDSFDQALCLAGCPAALLAILAGLAVLALLAGLAVFAGLAGPPEATSSVKKAQFPELSRIHPA